jgi:hypothetical protein
MVYGMNLIGIYIMNFKGLVILPLFVLASQVAGADTLEDFGWKKAVDDFEGTTSYAVDHGNYAYGCADMTISGVYGILNGEITSKKPLMLMYLLFGMEDIERKGALKWKSDDGSKSLEFSCDGDYSDGSWNNKCIVTGITAKHSESLMKTNFIRLDFPSNNIDLKEEGSTSGCEKLFTETKRLLKEYNSAVSK